MGLLNLCGKQSIDHTQSTPPTSVYSERVIDVEKADCHFSPKNQSDLYPVLILFPAENKSAIPYQGELSVNGIIEFLAAHGANSHFLYGNVGQLILLFPKFHLFSDFGHMNKLLK